MSACKLVSATQCLKSPRPPRSGFGGWTLDRRTACFVLQGDPYPYEIPLDRCRTSAALLDWILQIAGKVWATPIIIAGLVCAFDFYLDPQATLCSFGVERGPIDAPTVARRRGGR